MAPPPTRALAATRARRTWHFRRCRRARAMVSSPITGDRAATRARPRPQADPGRRPLGLRPIPRALAARASGYARGGRAGFHECRPSILWVVPLGRMVDA